MKLAILLIVLAWLLSVLVTMPRAMASAWMIEFIAAEAVFVFVCGVVLAETNPTDPKFARIFDCAFGLVLLFSVCLALDFNRVHPSEIRWWAIAAAWTPALMVPLILASRLEGIYQGKIPAQQFFQLALFGGFLCCGILALVSLVAPLSAFQQVARTAIGIDWLLQGIFGLAASLGFVRARAMWARCNDVVPVAIALVCFGVFAAMATRSQVELSRQHAAVHSIGAEQCVGPECARIGIFPK
jgi:hypothetical protein